MKIAAIIQARLGSTRLPGKTLALIEGRPMLWHVLERVRRSTLINQVILATTTNAQDDVLETFALDNQIDVIRGAENDVLDRFYIAALKHKVDIITRITPDCPLHDTKVIDLVITQYLQKSCDYASNTLTYSFPEGLDVEVFSFKSLEKAWSEAKKSSEREHVTLYIRNHPNLFKLENVSGPYDCATYHWSVDEAADLQFVRTVFKDFI